MGLFNNLETKRQNMVNSLLNVKDNEELLKKLTVLQNEISVGFDTKVVAISSIKGDDLQAAFAKAFAEAYALNGAKTLLIDANLYNPTLADMVKGDEVEVKDKEQSYKITVIDEKISALCLDKVTYPSDVYKSKVIQNAIKEHKDEYDHFVLIVPEVKNHKEIFLLGDIVESIVLLTFKSLTKKKDIFNAIQFFNANKLPLAKTVVLK